ncbi:MAG TPA: ATP-binding protein [Kaistia sp.]|nr:ATP-binding protein [Kaistia sp.]
MNGRDYAFLDLAALPAVGSALLAPRPTLLFQADGRRILFANAAGAAFFGERRMEALLDRTFSVALPATDQIARAARSLAPGASRLERIRFAGSAGFSSVAAECVRLTLPGGEPAVLVRLPEARGAGDTQEAARRLVDLLAAEDCLVAVLDANGATMADSGDFDVFVGEAAIADLVAASARVPGRPLKRAIRIGDSRRPAGLVAVETVAGLVHLLVVGPGERIEWEGAETLPPAEVQTVAPAEVAVSEPAPSAEHHAAEQPAAEPESIDASDETTEPVPAPVQAAEPEHLEPAVAEGFAFVEPAGPVRFVFQMDEAGRFTFVSPNFAEIVGPAAAIAVGESWGEMAARLGLDPTGAVASLIARRDTWSGVSLDWPVEGTNRLIAVDFAALPAFSRERLFEGYRGFGVIRPMERREPATVQSRPPLPSASVPPSAAPSNVIRLARAAPEQERLSPPEQDAFRRIAAALGGTPASRPTAEAALSPPAAASAGIEIAPPVEEIAGGEAAGTERAATEIAAEAHQEEQQVRAEPAPVAPAPEVGSEPAAEPGAIEIQPEASSVADLPAGDATAQDSALAVPDAEDQPAPELMLPTEAPDAPFVEARSEAAAAPDLVPQQDRRPVATAGSKSEPEARFISSDSALLPLMRRAETELVGARQRIVELEAILDTATDGIIVVDEDARIERINRSAEALFGVESASVTGLRLPDLLAEESRQSALDYLDGLARNGVASVLNDGREVIGRVPQGGLIPLFMTMGRLPETGKFCAVLRDITQWKNAEGELINAKRAAESASMQKSDFLAKVSHEIRTPLNAIIGFSEVMMEERFGPIGTERYKEYLRDIHLSGAHLMSLLNDLLDLSKIEAGKLDLTFEAVALNEIVMECVALMQPQANRERIIIRTSLSGQVPNIVADPRSIRQIVLNLVSNAVKFTLAGGQVIVSTAMEPHGEVTLRIRDTGIGMSEKDIETALKPFRQLSSSRERRSDGTGLGLPLTKALVEANRAAFAIDSSVGQGTLIRITFPATRVLAG